MTVRRARLGWAAGLLLVLLVVAGSSASALHGPRLPHAFRLTAGPLAGRPLYASRWTSVTSAVHDGHPSAELTRLAAIPQATWLTGGSPDAVAAQVERIAGAAQRSGAVPVLVVYDIPRRDCGAGQSRGGAPSAQAYRDYVSAIAYADRGRPALVVLEPDSLAQLDCLAPQYRQGRLQLLRWAVSALSAPHVPVYLDGGTRGWRPAAVMARRLAQAGVAGARGFAVDVANFDPTSAEIDYGRAISARIGWKRFVIDTSRNGASTAVRGWCNPSGRAVGALPGSPPGDPDVDALLWIKDPGESDGRCGSIDLPAGRFDPSAATSLMRAAGW